MIPMICTSIIKGVPTWNHVLKDYCSNGLFSDVTLKVINNGQVFSLRCHCLVIASWGGILNELLSNRENTDEDLDITLCETSSLLLEQLVTFMYNGSLTFKSKNDLESFKNLVSHLKLNPSFGDLMSAFNCLKNELQTKIQNKDNINDHKNNDEEIRVHTNLPVSTSEWREDFLQHWSSESNLNEGILTIDKSQIAYYFDTPSPTETNSPVSLFEDSPSTASANLCFPADEPSLTPTSFCSDNEDVGMKDLLALYSITSLEGQTAAANLPKPNRSSQLDSRCTYCHKVFISHHYLKFHESSVHQKDKKISCSICNKVFYGHYYLRQHHKRMHSESRPFACQLCQASFSVRYDLVVHQRTHDSVKPFPCSSCGKTYITQRALKEHKRTHTGERPYQCSVCKRRFALPKTLRVHYRQHSGERPYLCPKCGATFVQNSTLRNHIKNNHGSENLT